MSPLDLERVGSILQTTLRESPIRKGNQLKFHCPKCKHRKFKLEVSLDESMFHCWVCNYSGSIKKLLRECGAAINSIQEVNTIYNGKKYNNEEHKSEEFQLFLPSEFKPMWMPTTDIEYRHALYYCKRRGLTASDIIKYSIHYCIDGKFRNRIIIPSYDENGNLNFYTGRTWCDDVSLKYLNADAPRDIIGFDLFINWNLGFLNLVEGPLDAMATKRNTVCLFGKTLSNKLRHRIIEKNIKRINILLDNDAKKDIINMAEEFMNEGISVGVHLLEEKDPSKMGFKNMCDIIKNIKPIDFSDLMKLKLF
jgi:DNA primase